MTTERTAVFFGGVIPSSPGEERMAEEIGALLAGRGSRCCTAATTG